jgi:adenosylcobinamide-GDP ribazoletransferase
MPRQIGLFLAATQFLTRLPTPSLTEAAAKSLSESARYFSLVGVLIGSLNVGLWWLWTRWLPGGIAIGLMMAASLLITGALHEDGFADVCDGFGGAASRDRVLAIMKDSRIGAYGAMGIVMMLGLKWMTLAAIPPADFCVMVVGAHMMSRWCASGLIWRLHYVRADADAKSAPFADSLNAREWLLSGALGLLGMIPIVLVSAPASESRWPAVLAAAMAALGLAAIAGAYFHRRIGGYTGDCLGAVQQLSELAFLVGGLAILVPAPRPG